MTTEKQRITGICLGLLLLVVIVYTQVVGHDFVTYDDGDYVYANPHPYEHNHGHRDSNTDRDANPDVRGQLRAK